MSELSDVEVVAVGKAITDDKARKASKLVAVGEHEVDVTVRVRGTINRGEDYNQKIVLKADPWTLLLAALSHLNGVTIESLVKEANDQDPKLLDSIKKEANEALNSINETTETRCNGKVTKELIVEVVS
jgi:hypothetical protein